MEAEGAVVTVIDPRRSISVRKTLQDIWAYRELLFFLVWKEIKIRYKQTAVGAAWAVLQPLIAMVIFTFVFKDTLGVETDVPYPIFIYTGLVLWTYFSGTLNLASSCLINNQPLLTKVYFPRTLLPLSASLVGLVDYVIASVMMVILMLLFGVMPSLWFPLILVPLGLSFLLASGLGFWLSSVSAKYRDVRIIVPFFVQLLLFVTPILWPPSVTPGEVSWINLLNPLAAITEAQRSFAYGSGLVDWAPLGIAALISVAVFVFGLLYFNRYEKGLADVI